MTRTDPTDVPHPDAQLHFGVFFQGVNHWKIGLVSTSNTTFNESDLARRLSRLDLPSKGRAGWNVMTTDNAWTGANFRRAATSITPTVTGAPSSSSP